MSPDHTRRHALRRSALHAAPLALLLSLSGVVAGCDSHEDHHHIPPEVEEAAKYQVFTQHLGAAEYGPANWIKSPNYSTAYRKKGQITTVVVHTVQGSYNGCISWFQNPKAKVSAHYVISKTGKVTQMVKEKDIGWHVGSQNGYTIGIEHEGWVSDPKWATPAMVTASAKLTCYLVKKYGLTPTKTHIKGHVELPKQSHTDPGKYWPWSSYLSQVKSCVNGGGGGTTTCSGGCDDKNPCTQDLCSNGKCQHPWANGAVCWDGDACTAGEKCSNGKCVGGKIVKDCNDKNPCTNDGCKAGKCTHANNSNSCNDGNSCTSGDTCKSGSCIGGSTKSCNDGNPCTQDSCKSGACSHVANKALCSDGNSCTTGDACQNGKCVGGKPKACDDGNPCTTGDVCNPSTGACSAGVWKSCGGGDACSAGTCDPKSGGCKPANEGASCNDGNACTSGTVCKQGACVGGTVQGCEDNNPCTDDSCSAKGCAHVPNKMFCDDGQACTLADACVGGVCTGTAISCDDGDPCTTGQVCSGGQCSAGKSVCDDGNDCTSDSCASGVCSHKVVVVDCDDGDACTQKEYCESGVCLGGTPVPCDDGDPCTNDRCEQGKGCTHTNVCGADAGGADAGGNTSGGGSDGGSSDRPDTAGSDGVFGTDGFVPGGATGQPLASPSSGCTAGSRAAPRALWVLILAGLALVLRRRRDVASLRPRD